MERSEGNEKGLVYDVPTAGRMLNLSRATAYSLARKGVIPTIRFGKRVVVPKAALEKMVEDAWQPLKKGPKPKVSGIAGVKKGEDNGNRSKKRNE